MNADEVLAAFAEVDRIRQEWLKAERVYKHRIGLVLTRLLAEAVKNRMSVAQIAQASGLTPKRIRAEMRAIGLDPKKGKSVLSRGAADALHSNAELLGIEPSEMDLTSPLAYLPMGEELKKFLKTKKERE